MTCNGLMGTLNPTHSLTPLLKWIIAGRAVTFQGTCSWYTASEFMEGVHSLGR